MDSIRKLIEEQVKDVFSAEKQLTQALPRMAKAATHENLKEAFESHLAETHGHVKLLTEVAQMLDISLGRKKCKAMEGLIEEGKEVMEEDGDPAVLDLALIGAAQRVEHYEIAAYGTLQTLAAQLGEMRLANIFGQILDEEKEADSKLTGISTGDVLPEAMAQENNQEEGAEKKSRPGKGGRRAA